MECWDSHGVVRFPTWVAELLGRLGGSDHLVLVSVGLIKIVTATTFSVSPSTVRCYSSYTVLNQSKRIYRALAYHL